MTERSNLRIRVHIRYMDILLHIPPLVAYLTTTHVDEDLYAPRKNACTVVKEMMTLAAVSVAQPGTTASLTALGRQEHLDRLHDALNKCAKRRVSTCGDQVYQALISMHEALKKTPPIQRPIQDSEDTCNETAWHHETSFIRELCGIQLDHPALGLSHPLVIDCRSTPAVSLDDHARRVPLVLVCLVHPETVLEDRLAWKGVGYVLHVATDGMQVHTSPCQNPAVAVYMRSK